MTILHVHLFFVIILNAEGQHNKMKNVCLMSFFLNNIYRFLYLSLLLCLRSDSWNLRIYYVKINKTIIVITVDSENDIFSYYSVEKL